MLIVLELCNVIDFLMVDFIRDFFMFRENVNVQRLIVNFNKVFEFCEDILLDRFIIGQVSIDDFMDEGDC